MFLPLRHALGLQPACWRKKLPKNDWLANDSSAATCLMLFSGSDSRRLASFSTIVDIHSQGVRPLRRRTSDEK